MLDDKVTAARVAGALENLRPVPLTNIQVSVTGGLVRLDGSVQNAQQKEQATTAAQSVDHVKKVENRLAVSP